MTRARDLADLINSPPSGGGPGLLLHVQDRKPLGTNGGTITAGDWRTRSLSSTPVFNAIPGASVSGNRIILPAGTYHGSARAPVFTASVTSLRLYDITHSVELARSINEYSVGSAATTTNGLGFRFTLSEETQIELQHRSLATVNDVGFGVPTSFAEEIFADIMIWKI